MTKTAITFVGGTGTVTGANFLIESDGSKLLVDCGLFQGAAFCDTCNEAEFPYDPKDIEVLLVTHAHLDHVGRIPKLARDGFRGVIYSTEQTRSLAELIMLDAMRLMTEEANREHREPFYNEQDVAQALSLWKSVPYHQDLVLPGGFTAYLKDAGHVLGSTMYELRKSDAGARLVFTGDLGNSPSLLLRDTESIKGASYIVMESVYGDRNHEPKEDRRPKLKRIAAETMAKGGTLIIPSFALERTQNLLYEFNQLIESGDLARVPIFVDSPLAIKITDIYRRSTGVFKEAVQEQIAKGDDIFNFPGLVFTERGAASQAIGAVHGAKIIIAGSGMSAGGRVISHERQYLDDPKNTILFVGYQAAGSLGRQIQEGVKKITIDGEHVTIRCRIETISGYSAHKDSQGLQDFIADTADTVKKVFIAMGEPKSSLFLAQRLHDYEGIDAIVPTVGQRIEIDM